MKHDLLLATKVIIYVNRNYVNLAVKFKNPNYMELRPLKCCIGPKLTPRVQEFRTWKCLFCPSRNIHVFHVMYFAIHYASFSGLITMAREQRVDVSAMENSKLLSFCSEKFPLPLNA